MIHMPKVDTLDLRTNAMTDWNGTEYQVWNLKVESDVSTYHRPEAYNPRLSSAGCAVFATRQIRVVRWQVRPGAERASDFDYYIDLGAVRKSADQLQFVDHYLDILLWHGSRAEVVDGAELDRAVEAGHVSQQVAVDARAGAERIIDELYRVDFAADDWLARCGVDVGLLEP